MTISHSQVRTEVSSPLSSPPLVSSPIHFLSSANSPQKLGRGKQEGFTLGEQTEKEKRLLWVEEEKQMRLERERKVQEEEEKQKRAEREVEEKAKRQVEEAERKMREDRERQIRDNGDKQMKLEAESRMKEESRRLLTPKKEEKNASSMKKIEVRSSSSSLSEDDPVTIIPSLPPQPFSINNNMKVSGDQSRNGFDLSSTMTKADPMPDSSEVSLHGRASVGLQSDSAATSDYSESDSGTPVIARKAVPVHQSSSESLAIIRRAVPVHQDTSSGSETGSEEATTMRRAMPVVDSSEEQSEAGFVRQAIPVAATDSDASSICSGLKILFLCMGVKDSVQVDSLHNR